MLPITVVWLPLGAPANVTVPTPVGVSVVVAPALVIVIAVVRAALGAVLLKVAVTFCAVPPGVMVNVFEPLVTVIALPVVVIGKAVKVAAAVCPVPPGFKVKTFPPLVIVKLLLICAGTVENVPETVPADPAGVMLSVLPPLVITI